MLSNSKSADLWRADLNDLNAQYSLQVEELVETLLISVRREYQRQLADAEKEHAHELREAQQQNVELNDQLTSTVSMYNSLMADLKVELKQTHQQLTEVEQRREKEIRQLTDQTKLDDDQIKSTLDEYKGIIKDLKQQLEAAKRRDTEKDNNHQRQRLVLIQTNDRLKAEVDDLKAQLQQLSTAGDSDAAPSR